MNKNDQDQDIIVNEEENNDDIILDEEVDESENQTDVIKKLREKLKTAVEEKQKYLDNWQRDRADFINSKKRAEEEKISFIKYAKEGIIEDIIPVLEGFDMAQANKEAWEKVDKNWRVGIESLSSKLNEVLKSHGLEKIYPLGNDFDPKEHQAVSLISTNKKEEDNKVLEVLSPGFNLSGKNIKPAQVKVGEFSE